MDAYPTKFLIAWGWSLLGPPAVLIAILRGRFEDEPRSWYRWRVGIGLFLSVAGWLLIASTIAIRDYFSAVWDALEKVSLFEKIAFPAVNVLLAIAVAGAPKWIRRRSGWDADLDNLT